MLNFVVHLLVFLLSFPLLSIILTVLSRFSLRSLRNRSPQERGGRGNQSHVYALNGSPGRGHRRGRGKYAIMSYSGFTHEIGFHCALRACEIFNFPCSLCRTSVARPFAGGLQHVTRPFLQFVTKVRLSSSKRLVLHGCNSPCNLCRNSVSRQVAGGVQRVTIPSVQHSVTQMRFGLIPLMMCKG